MDWQPVSDALWYYERGLSLALGEGYSLAGQPTALFPVGYPAFIGGIFKVLGNNILWVQLAQVALSGGMIWCVYVLSKRWFASEKGARIAMLIIALYPNYIAYCPLLLSEILFTSLLLFSLTIRRLQSILFALCCLVKPLVLFVPFLFFVSKKKKFKRRVREVGGIYLVVLLMIIPWAYRNYQLWGTLIPFSNNGGINLLIGNNPHATGTYHFEGPVEALLPNGLDEASRDRAAAQLARTYLTDHPLEAIARLPLKWKFLFERGSEGVYWTRMGGKSPQAPHWLWANRLAQAGYLALFGLFALHLLLSLYPSYRKRITYPFLPLALCLYFLLIYSVFFGYSRFHFPMVPFVAMVVGGVVQRVHWRDWIRG